VLETTVRIFDNNYWEATPSTNGHLFVCGTNTTDTSPYHYWIGFSSYPVINSTPTGSLARNFPAGTPCTPYNEIYNPNLNLAGNATHHDMLISGLVGAGTNGYIITNDISLGSVPGALHTVNYPGGVSGQVVDNVSSSGQASSIYFSTLTTSNVGTCGGNRCAVKLTQSALN